MMSRIKTIIEDIENDRSCLYYYCILRKERKKVKKYFEKKGYDVFDICYQGGIEISWSKKVYVLVDDEPNSKYLQKLNKKSYKNAIKDIKRHINNAASGGEYTCLYYHHSLNIDNIIKYFTDEGLKAIKIDSHTVRFSWGEPTILVSNE